MESSRLIETYVSYVLNNFFFTLTTAEQKRNYLSFEKKHGQKIAEMRSKPMLGIAIGLYRNLGEQFEGHPWLKGNRVPEKMNTLNEIRKMIAHPATIAFDVEESAFLACDSAKHIISQTGFEATRLKHLNFPLYTYLLYSTIKDRFVDPDPIPHETIVQTSKRLYPILLNALWRATYSTLSTEQKEKCLGIQEEIFGKRVEADYTLEIVDQFFRKGCLYRDMESGMILSDALTQIFAPHGEKVNKMHARRHIQVLDILFRNFKIAEDRTYFEFARQVKDTYLISGSIEGKDEERLRWSARMLLLSEHEADRITLDVVTAIDKNLSPFESLARAERENQTPIIKKDLDADPVSPRKTTIGSFSIQFTFGGDPSQRKRATNCLNHYFVLHQLIFQNEFDTELLCSIGSSEYIMASLKSGVIYIHDYGNYRDEFRRFSTWCDLLRSYRKAKALRYRNVAEFVKLPLQTWDYAILAIDDLSKQIKSFYQENDPKNLDLAMEIDNGTKNFFEAEALLCSTKDATDVGATLIGQLVLRLEFSITSFHKVILENPLSMYLNGGAR